MKKYHNYSGDDLTFVIIAYKVCEYLEDCIKSLLKQKTKAKILISTSTPNEHIKKLAKKYKIEVRVNPEGGQVKDFNFAMAQPDTDLVMMMHQDEVLSDNFVDEVLDAINHSKKPIIAFTNYIEMHNDKVDDKPSSMVKIKRMMLLPLKIRGLSGTRLGKRGVQMLGNSITHPTVVCVMRELPKKPFREKYKAAMDWDLWERLSRQKGNFVYVNDVLLYHRMNDDNQSAKLLNSSNVRGEEEYEILSRFWPKMIAKQIARMYGKAAKYY